MAQKPPLGVRPKWLLEEHRFEELCEAVVRYRRETLPIPDEWLEEIQDLAGKFLARSKLRELRSKLAVPETRESTEG